MSYLDELERIQLAIKRTQKTLSLLGIQERVRVDEAKAKRLKMEIAVLVLASEAPDLDVLKHQLLDLSPSYPMSLRLMQAGYSIEEIREIARELLLPTRKDEHGQG